MWRNHDQWRHLHIDVKAFNNDYEFPEASRWLKSLERLSEESSKREANDNPLLSSSMVITVGSGNQAIILAKAGIVIYGIRYTTTPFLDSALDSIVPAATN
jgi:hypothetical protein